MDANEQSGYFDAHYYAHNCGRPYQRDEAWQQFFGNIADRIVSDIEPATVLDAGGSGMSRPMAWTSPNMPSKTCIRI
jgi:hypothetical protein